MNGTATAIAKWVAETPVIDGVLFGSSDGEVDGPPVCAVAVAGKHRGYGKGHSQSHALASAVGEALEQVAAHQIDQQHLFRASFADIEAEAFDPRWLGLYSETQYARADFPFRPFDSQAPLHWLAGRWLDTGERVYLPAFAVYLSAEFSQEALCQVTSNGLGAGETLTAAIEHAVLELYERDAFLRSWMNLLPKRKVSVEDPGGILSHLQSRGANTEVYLLMDSPAYVAMALAKGDGVRWPAFTLGLGAARNQGDAIDKAVLELGQTSPYLARIWRRHEVPLPAAPQDIKTLQDQALYYCDPSHRGEFLPFLNAPLGCNQVPAVSRFAIADISRAELPYRVVRAIGRGLRPVHCGYGFERLTDVPIQNTAPCPLL